MAVHDVIKSVRYTAVADTKEDAWMFYMSHVDEFSKPNMELLAIWVVDNDAEEGEYLEKYQITISGDIED